MCARPIENPFSPCHRRRAVSPRGQDEYFHEDGEQERWTCLVPWCIRHPPFLPPHFPLRSPLLEHLFVRDLSLICVRSKGRICVLVPSNGILCASMRLSAAQYVCARVVIHARACTHTYTFTARSLLYNSQVRKIVSRDPENSPCSPSFVVKLKTREVAWNDKWGTYKDHLIRF